MPAGIPEDVVHIDLSNNSIIHLKAKDFLGTKSLRILNISHNSMQHADTGMCTATFVRLKKTGARQIVKATRSPARLLNSEGKMSSTSVL